MEPSQKVLAKAWGFGEAEFWDVFSHIYIHMPISLMVSFAGLGCSCHHELRHLCAIVRGWRWCIQSKTHYMPQLVEKQETNRKLTKATNPSNFFPYFHSAQSIFIVCRQSNCVPSQGSFAVAPKNAYIPRSRTATWGWAWETLLHPRMPGAFYICIQYMHWFVCEIMRQRSYHNWKGPENQQEIQNHDHGADPMVYESSLHHGHELVDIKASHMYIYIIDILCIIYIYICMYNISYIYV